MPDYKYQGRWKNKEFIENIIESPSIEEAIFHLTEQGITLIAIRPAKEKNWLKTLLSLRLDKPTVKIQEMIIFCRQLHSLTKAGVSLLISIKRLGEISHNPTFRETLYGIQRSILAGQSFATCLNRYPHIFSPLFIELVHLGEESGQLEQAFFQIGNYLSLEYETRKKFKAAVRYPLMVLITIFGAIMIVNIFVVPNFAKLYSSFQTKLPLPTILMIKFSTLLQHSWGFLLSGIILLFFIIRYYLKTPQGKFNWDRYQFTLPIVGSIFERIVLSRFSRTMAIVFTSGIPLEKGISLVAGSVGNTYAKERILMMRQHIENGESLSQAATETRLFSALVLQMIAIGEETGAMENMLAEIALFYEREVDYELESLGNKIEPILLSVVAIMVLVLAIAVFLPMWDIYQFAQGGHS